jgi:hypothetical protein
VLADDSAGPALLDSLGSVTNVLYAPDISASQFDADAGFLLFSATRRLTAALATMASPPKLFMLVHEAISNDQDNPAHAVLWGLGRMLALQHPDIWGGIVEFREAAASESLSDESDSVRADDPAGEIKDTWRVCGPEQRRALLRDHVGMLVAAVMGLPAGQSLNPSADFFELGMDSLMSVLLQRALAETLGELLDQSVVFDFPTVEELAEHLATIGDADQELAEADLSGRVS